MSANYFLDGGLDRFRRSVLNSERVSGCFFFNTADLVEAAESDVGGSDRGRRIRHCRDELSLPVPRCGIFIITLYYNIVWKKRRSDFKNRYGVFPLIAMACDIFRISRFRETIRCFETTIAVSYYGDTEISSIFNITVVIYKDGDLAESPNSSFEIAITVFFLRRCFRHKFNVRNYHH